MEKDLYEYLQMQMLSAIDGDLGPRWPSAEAERLSKAIRGVFDEALLTNRARERLLIRLGLACVSLLLQRHRAAMVASAAESKSRRSSADASSGNYGKGETGNE